MVLREVSGLVTFGAHRLGSRAFLAAVSFLIAVVADPIWHPSRCGILGVFGNLSVWVGAGLLLCFSLQHWYFTPNLALVGAFYIIWVRFVPSLHEFSLGHQLLNDFVEWREWDGC